MTVHSATRICGLALTALTLAGCAAADYGDIQHSAYVANPRCDPSEGRAVPDADALPLFFVTSRLPDCRADAVHMLSYRADHLRFGRFGEPLLREDADGDKHLRVPLTLQAEGDWWRDLHAATDGATGRVLIYVHGFHESFATSSKDSMQIARMTGFEGPVIEYSWPSQGKVQSYAADETNALWDGPDFRNFLTRLVELPWIKDVVIVSHSMGARLVIPAIHQIDAASTAGGTNKIHSIILASPDIDRGIFEREIADAVHAPHSTAANRHLLVYVSRQDKAVGLSRRIHGFPRLGSPYCFNRNDPDRQLFDKKPYRCYATLDAGDARSNDLTIVDTTDVSRGLTGHSDFLHSAPVCRDFIAAVQGEKDYPDRIATRLAHVFRLLPDPRNPKPDDAMICKRLSKTEHP